MERVSSLVSLLIRKLLNQGPALVHLIILNCFLRASSLNTATVGIRVSIYEFGGQGDIQSLTSSPVVTLSEIFVQEVLVWRKCDS